MDWEINMKMQLKIGIYRSVKIFCVNDSLQELSIFLSDLFVFNGNVVYL
jgi:hypothetical protein